MGSFPQERREWERCGKVKEEKRDGRGGWMTAPPLVEIKKKPHLLNGCRLPAQPRTNYSLGDFHCSTLWRGIKCSSELLQNCKREHQKRSITKFNLLFLSIFFNQFFPPTLFTKSGNTATSPQQKRNMNSWIISLVVRKPTARPDYAHWHKVANGDWLQPLWCASNVLCKHFNNSDYTMLEKNYREKFLEPRQFSTKDLSTQQQQCQSFQCLPVNESSTVLGVGHMHFVWSHLSGYADKNVKKQNLGYISCTFSNWTDQKDSRW